MQSPGFRRLDFDLEEELFGRAPTQEIPRYSASKIGADIVTQKLAQMHPDWRYQIEEDQWGYTATWQCPFPVGSGRYRTIGQFRASAISVAICRASLVAIRNYDRYIQRFQERGSQAQQT